MGSLGGRPAASARPTSGLHHGALHAPHVASTVCVAAALCQGAGRAARPPGRQAYGFRRDALGATWGGRTERRAPVLLGPAVMWWSFGRLLPRAAACRLMHSVELAPASLAAPRCVPARRSAAARAARPAAPAWCAALELYAWLLPASAVLE